MEEIRKFVAILPFYKTIKMVLNREEKTISFFYDSGELIQFEFGEKLQNISVPFIQNLGDWYVFCNLIMQTFDNISKELLPQGEEKMEAIFKGNGEKSLFGSGSSLYYDLNQKKLFLRKFGSTDFFRGNKTELYFDDCVRDERSFYELAMVLGLLHGRSVVPSTYAFGYAVMYF